MKTELDTERRSTQSAPLRPGALRCGNCGTTWFEAHAELAACAGRSCRRCGGALHTERRQAAAVRRAA